MSNRKIIKNAWMVAEVQDDGEYVKSKSRRTRGETSVKQRTRHAMEKNQ